MRCRWEYLEDRTDRSAKVAVIVATVIGLLSVGWAIMWKRTLALREEQAEKQRQEKENAKAEREQSLELAMPPEPAEITATTCTLGSCHCHSLQTAAITAAITAAHAAM
jgi:hypothetical protein